MTTTIEATPGTEEAAATLLAEQVEAYKHYGYIVIPNVLRGEELGRV